MTPEQRIQDAMARMDAITAEYPIGTIGVALDDQLSIVWGQIHLAEAQDRFIAEPPDWLPKPAVRGPSPSAVWFDEIASTPLKDLEALIAKTRSTTKQAPNA